MTSNNIGLTTYATLALGALGVVFLSNWPTYSFLARGGPGLVWYYVAAAVLIVPVLFAEPHLTLRLLREPLVWWFVVFVLSAVVWMTFAHDFERDALATLRPRIAALGLFYTVAVLGTQCKRPLVGLLIVAMVLLACATTWFDVLRPYRFLQQGQDFAGSGRGAGLFVNPNIAAAFIGGATIVALPLIPMLLRGALVLAAVIGIVPTFSRAGYIYAVIFLILPMFMRLLDRKQALLVLITVPALVVATAASYDYLMHASDDQNLHNVIRRLDWFRGLEPEDDAVSARLHGAQVAWNMFLDAPLTGMGIGATLNELTVQIGPHNMYLLFMAEQGFFGVALYLTLIWLIARRGRQLAKTALDREDSEVGKAMILLALFFVAYSFFSHNVLEEPHIIYLLAFLTAASFQAPRAVTAWVKAPVSDFRRRAPAGHATSG